MEKLSFTSLFLFSTYAFAQTGNVGIGTTNPQAQLHTTGSVLHESLQGTEIKQVYAAASEELINFGSLKKTVNQVYKDNCEVTSSAITVSNRSAKVNAGKIRVKRESSRQDWVFYLQNDLKNI